MDENKEYWAINSVIIRKPYDLEKAEEEVKKFITSGSKKRPRETKTSYRFRNLDKQKFIKGTFRTKKINKNISLVFGQLKSEYNHLEGAGFFDFIKKPIRAVKEFFSPRQGLNNTSTKTLKTYGSGVIDSITIARTPIESIIDKTINLISFGKWSQLKKEYKFDELFHLALLVKIGGKNIVIEKNEVINISTSYKISNKTETLDVPLNGKKITLDELIDKTRNFMGKDFIPYDGFKNNCQFFTRAVLQSNGLYGEKEKDFLFQDLEELSKKMPWLTKKIMNLTTNTGAIVNKIMGKGEPTKMHLTKLDDLTVKHLRRIAKEYNEYMLIEKFYVMNKKDLISELEKHLEIVKGELILKDHIFEVLKKNKNDVNHKRLNILQGFGKSELGKEFKMDEADHNKKLGEFEKSMPSQETIQDVLKELKHMTNSGLNHINKLEELVGGSSKSSGFIRAIMSGKDKKEANQFRKYNREGFNELKIDDNKLTQASGDLVRRKFKDKDYKKFVLFLSLPSATDLYNNNEMRDLYLADKKKAHEAIQQVETLIHNEANLEKGINEKYPKFKELDAINKEIIRIQYKQAVIASIMSKYYNKLTPIVGQITTDMNARIKENTKRYREKKKGKKVKKDTSEEDEYNNERFKKYWEQVKNLKKGEEMEPFERKEIKEKEVKKEVVKEKGMTRGEIDKELKKKLKDFKAILKKDETIRTPLPKRIKKPKFDYKNASSTQKEVNKVINEWLSREKKEDPKVETEIKQNVLKKGNVDEEKIRNEIRKVIKRNLDEEEFKKEIYKIQKREDLSNREMAALSKSAFVITENIKTKLEEKQAIKIEEEKFDELEELLKMAEEYED